jgi:NADPH2:quinone reductase
MQLTGGRGFDLIIEMLANKNLQTDLGLLAKKGRVVVVGSRGPTEINPRDAMARDADIRGFTLFNATEPELREIRAALVAGLETGTLHPVVGTRIPLAEARRAHEEIMKSSGALGKMVLTVG